MLAALIQGPIVRLVPVGMILLALQRTVFVDVRVDGVIIQVLLALAAAAGAAGGSERGAIAGFVFGIMYDLVEGTPLGSTAIAFTLAGIVAGLLPLVAADPQWWLLGLFTALGAAAGEAAVPVVRLFIGEEEPFPADMVQVVSIVAAGAFVLSPVFVPLARWCLRIRQSEWKAPAEETAV